MISLCGHCPTPLSALSLPNLCNTMLIFFEPRRGGWVGAWTCPILGQELLAILLKPCHWNWSLMLTLLWSTSHVKTSTCDTYSLLPSPSTQPKLKISYRDLAVFNPLRFLVLEAARYYRLTIKHPYQIEFPGRLHLLPWALAWHRGIPSAEDHRWSFISFWLFPLIQPGVFVRCIVCSGCGTKIVCSGWDIRSTCCDEWTLPTLVAPTHHSSRSSYTCALLSFTDFSWILRSRCLNHPLDRLAFNVSLNLVSFNSIFMDIFNFTCEEILLVQMKVL